MAEWSWSEKNYHPGLVVGTEGYWIFWNQENTDRFGGTCFDAKYGVNLDPWFPMNLPWVS